MLLIEFDDTGMLIFVQSGFCDVFVFVCGAEYHERLESTVFTSSSFSCHLSSFGFPFIIVVAVLYGLGVAPPPNHPLA
jgi:hypothetical protein